MIQTLGAQTLAVLLVLAIVLGPAAAAVHFLSRRKRLALRERRSPLAANLLRPPGHTLRKQLEEGRVDLGGKLMVLVLLPALLLAFLYVTSLVTGRQNSMWLLIVVALGIAVSSAYQIRKLQSHAKQMKQWGLGLDAEMAAGQELDQLMRSGAAVYHDLAADKFSIDHVVIARQTSERETIRRRRVQEEFIAHGLRSREDAERTGIYHSTESVHAELQRRLDARRKSVQGPP